MYLFSVGQQQSVLFFRSSGMDAADLTSTTLALSTVQAALAGVAGYFLLPVALAGPATLLSDARLYLWSIALNLPTLPLVGLVQAAQRFRVYNALRLIVPAGFVAGTFLLHAFHRLSVHSILAMLLALSGAGFLATAWAVRATVTRSLGRVDVAIARQLLGYGAKVQLGDLSQTVNLRLDQALLAAWFPTRELGLYTAAVSVSSLTEVLSTGYRMVVSPKVAAQETDAGRARVAHAYLRRYFAANTLLTAALIPLAALLIPLLYSQAFAPSIRPAQLLIVAGFFLGGKSLMQGVAQSAGRPMLATRAELISLPVTAISLPLLLPRMGITGAALASLLCYSTQFLVLLLGLRKAGLLSVSRLASLRRTDLVSERL